MFERFYPYEYVESAFAIDYNKLFELDFRGIIFDIDNTLVPHGTDCTPEVEALFDKIHRIGFKTLLLSDNTAERIERFKRNIDTLYIADACKPDPTGFKLAVELLGFPRRQIVVIGDQVFTDIRGANQCEIPSILVKYIGHDEPGPKGKRRALEQRILKGYEKDRRKKVTNRIGDIELEQENVPEAQPVARADAQSTAQPDLRAAGQAVAHVGAQAAAHVASSGEES